MVSNDVEREIASRSLDYGNHTIEISVSIQPKSTWHPYVNRILGEVKYEREVHVKAKHEGETEIENYNYVFLPKSPSDISKKEVILYNRGFTLLGIARLFMGDSFEQNVRKVNTPPPLEDQIEDAVKPVFEELDMLYDYTTVDYEIEVETGMQRVKHEMSWVEVEEEIETLVSNSTLAEQ